MTNLDKEKAITLITEIIKEHPQDATVVKINEFCNCEFNNITANDFTSNYLIKSNWSNRSTRLNKTAVGLIDLSISADKINFKVKSLTNFDNIHKIGRSKTIVNKILGFKFEKEIKYFDLYPQISYEMTIGDLIYNLDIEEFNFIMSCYYKSYELYDQREKTRIKEIRRRKEG